VNAFLLPLSAVFRAGVALRQAGYQHGWLPSHRLARPVVSVGNLTVGGTGKTPLVVYIAGLLIRRGWTPSILTRGYGRGSKAETIVVPPEVGRRADPCEIGDEPALLARALPEVPLVIGANRFRGGRAAEERFAVGAHLLDDGFQHRALARDVDIVVLDATQPLSNWQLLPAGRQREPVSALRRAHMVVITRTDVAPAAPLQALAARTSPALKVFLARTELCGWVDALSGAAVSPAAIESKPVAVFCGLGNPRAFFADVRRWGFRPVLEKAFPDHHVYTEAEIGQLAAEARRHGAGALLTTQKDAVKFHSDWQPQVPVWACQTETRIDDPGDFEKTLITCLEEAHA
jgi:tetraacyldisaccharide 4'-kinase